MPHHFNSRNTPLTYVVTEACINCKYQDCVVVCPVDCFYEGANMLVINPGECIDCGVCVPECPVKAIISDQEADCTEALVDFNGEYARIWPRIREIGVVPADADAWRDVLHKMDHFDPAPGGSKT